MFSLLSLRCARSFINVRILGLVGLAAVLGACQSTPKQEEQPPVAQQVQAPVELTAQQKVINSLLSEADYCLSQNKLLNPIADNAHDRYRSVLLMDPENERAKLGLQTISLRFVELARTAARRGNVSEAQTMIKYARGVDNNPVVQDAAETLRKQLGTIPAAKPYTPGEGEVVLDAKLLQAKDPQITTQLVGVAQKAKKTDEFVLIIARTDAEGRYIYQLLRNAVPGYLVRGDIKIGSPARVKLVKSLD
ncbi:hypothetical protein GCM10011613_09930 [Cellvibrio zantedeschiae]|uniref:Lipoprotein n=1 Tax=Cellvibrio zantedeschiae TaxID=1237077 RepID=A0ABQ3AY94_9GAMM|nr:hypothetical protein [Cellvibrio zantedeschiae]GGY67748.1 hypothetical protein GCM10011613_09930 [Cellvibrio zantedeschiae]